MGVAAEARPEVGRDGPKERRLVPAPPEVSSTMWKGMGRPRGPSIAAGGTSRRCPHGSGAVPASRGGRADRRRMPAAYRRRRSHSIGPDVEARVLVSCRRMRVIDAEPARSRSPVAQRRRVGPLAAASRTGGGRSAGAAGASGPSSTVHAGRRDAIGAPVPLQRSIASRTLVAQRRAGSMPTGRIRASSSSQDVRERAVLSPSRARVAAPPGGSARPRARKKHCPS